MSIWNYEFYQEFYDRWKGYLGQYALHDLD